MDIILHIGAHRTGSTSFQRYLQANRGRLSRLGIGGWGPWRTRKGLFHGLAGRPETPTQAQRAAGRVQLNLNGTARRGVAVLVVSEENMIGSMRTNLRSGLLYPEIGERMARIHAGFGSVRRIVLQIRSLETWWASTFAYMIPRGASVPDPRHLDFIAENTRSWRHVITDLSCACPGAEILVTPFERFAPHPDRLLHRMTGAMFLPRAEPGAFWANRAPYLPALREVLVDRGEDPAVLPEGEGRYQPFSDAAATALREAYADDLFWLQAGADGMAILTEEARSEKSGLNRMLGAAMRGQADDEDARRMAPTR